MDTQTGDIVPPMISVSPPPKESQTPRYSSLSMREWSKTPRSNKTPHSTLVSPTKGQRHGASPLPSTDTPSLLPMPLLYGIKRQSTNLSQLSNYSTTSSLQGPLTQERNKLRHVLRTRTRGGTRYVMTYNDFHCKVIKEDGESVVNARQARSSSRNSLPDYIRFGYSARPTASGLTDPWEDLKMDTQVLPRISDRHLVTASPEPYTPISARSVQKKKRGEGSTICPQFPIVSMPNSDYNKRTIYYDQVNKLREDLDIRKLLVHRQKKDVVDYEKTKQDFYRMELDQVQALKPASKTRMCETYFAYLRNTPGSKKAIQECIKRIG